MAALTVQEISLSGLDVTLAAADAGGDTFPNTGREYFDVDNASGGSVNVTFDATGLCNQGFDHDTVVAVPAGGRRRIGPFSVNRFGTPVSVSYSSATSVTVAAVSLS